MTALLVPHACVGDMRDGDKVATADGDRANGGRSHMSSEPLGQADC
jgi:hypothetical protein